MIWQMRRPVFTLTSWASLLVMAAISFYATTYKTGDFSFVRFLNGWSAVVGNGQIILFREDRRVGELPVESLAIPFALLPLAWAITAYRSERRRKAIVARRCAKCGYDLRASNDRCPECGTLIQAEGIA